MEDKIWFYSMIFKIFDVAAEMNIYMLRLIHIQLIVKFYVKILFDSLEFIQIVLLNICSRHDNEHLYNSNVTIFNSIIFVCDLLRK
jgi:hypothetical protein